MPQVYVLIYMVGGFGSKGACKLRTDYRVCRIFQVAVHSCSSIASLTVLILQVTFFSRHEVELTPTQQHKRRTIRAWLLSTVCT